MGVEENKMNKSPEKELSFSVELKSKTNLKNVTLSNGNGENVLVEGSIGHLISAGFVETTILEIIGDRGVLRINLEKNEIKEAKKK